MSLVDELIKEGYLKTPRIIEAFRNINRADFLPENLKYESERNVPLPIGCDQTISQPLTVAFMLELLQPEPGDKILDIGSGSGWATALLAYIVSGGSPIPKSEIQNPKPKTNSKSQILNSKHGKVYAIERICELMEFGKQNVAKYNFIEKGIVKMICGDGSKGWPGFDENGDLIGGFDKIHAAAAVGGEIPQAWRDQLKIGGRLVTPVGGSVYLLIKKSEKEFVKHEYPGFAFVPLIEE